MKFRVLFLSIFLCVVAGGLLTYFRQQSMVSTEVARQQPADDIPQPAKTGPFPKAVTVGSLIHNFGTMEQHQEGEHTFTIRNEGQAPLEMVARKEDHSCQCTIGTLGQNGLKPGEETTITLKWGIKNPNTLFQHHATVRTNDPKKQTLTFRVEGLVGRRLVLKPGPEILLGALVEGQPTKTKMTIHSEVLDSFELTMLEPSMPNLMEVKSRQLTAAEITELTLPDPAEAERRKHMIEAAKSSANVAKPNSGTPADPHKDHDHEKVHVQEPSSLEGKTPDAKFGYEIEVIFLPGFPIGTFHESLTIRTNVEQMPEMRVAIHGYRSGPIQILPTAGVSWSAQESLLNWGRFPAAQGKKVRLMVFVKKSDQEFKIESATIDPPVLKYELVKDTKFQAAGREKYDLFLEVPGGNSTISLGAMNRGTIKFITNHPEAKEIKLEIEMASHKE